MEGALNLQDLTVLEERLIISTTSLSLTPLTTNKSSPPDIEKDMFHVTTLDTKLMKMSFLASRQLHSSTLHYHYMRLKVDSEGIDGKVIII